MQFFQPFMLEREISPTPFDGPEQSDLRSEDPPPMDRPSENYSAWGATAIFNLAPFSSPRVR